MNVKLKVALIRHFGSQVRAAKALGVSESRLSRLVQGWAEPKKAEVETFKRVLGKRSAAKLFPTPTTGADQVNGAETGFDTS